MARGLGLAASVLWLLLAWRWFDAGVARPAWLEALPPWILAVGVLVSGLAWLRSHWPGLRTLGPPSPWPRYALAAAGLAVLFRLPLVVQGAAGAVTPDGALSGIVMLRVLNGAEHLVFVPQVPYSGSLKSHLAAGLALLMDPARAFALASVLFYAAFAAAAVCHAALLAGATRATVLGSALYAAFAPPFVTRYSVSNDGNYVEVLALGAWALLLTGRGARAGGEAAFAWTAGVLLGLAFWSHILAVIPLAACALLLLVAKGRQALGAGCRLATGWVLGYTPGLLWNLANRGESFRYLLPGGPKVGGNEEGPGLWAMLKGLVTDHLPALLGYDAGQTGTLDMALRLLGGLGALLLVVALLAAARRLRREPEAMLGALLMLALVNLVVAWLALPYIPGNARYLLLLAGPAFVLLPWAFAGSPVGRVGLLLLLGGGAAASVAQLPGTVRADARWRAFVADLEAAEVRRCYTDFHLATKVNFLSGERVVCSSELGPTTTEYFREYRDIVGRAPAAAFVAVNSSAARKLESLLRARGVHYDRRDLMKPVVIPAVKVAPRDLFPGRGGP